MGKDQDLLDAARNGNIEAVCKICSQISRRRSGPLVSIRWRPNINVQDMNGYTPLHHACLNGHKEVVRLLIEHDAAVDVPDIRGSTPLYLAAWAGHRDITKMLLVQGKTSANPNMQTIDNDTPLHCAAQNGNNEVLAILLRHGGDPTIRNNHFQTALDLAAQFGRLQAVQILLHSHPQLIDLLRAPSDERAVQHSSGHSSPYECANSTPARNIISHSCLHLASRNGHKEVVRVLLAAGVDVNILTQAGTALHEAALCGKKSVVLILLEAGVDPDAVDGAGKTALDILRDYPPHVTYEIVSAINDFCQRAGVGRKADSPFRPITDVNENREDCVSRNRGGGGNNTPFTRPRFATTPRSSKSPEMAHNRSASENQARVAVTTTTAITATAKPIPKKLTSGVRSNSVESLRRHVHPTGNYVPMKPIPPTKSSNNLMAMAPPVAPTNDLLSYQPVYKQLSISPINFASRSPTAMLSLSSGSGGRFAGQCGCDVIKASSHERLPRLMTASANGSNGGVAGRNFHCVDQYVKMSKSEIGTAPTTALAITPPPPPVLPLKMKKPLPAPRTLQTGDYANLDEVETDKRSGIVLVSDDSCFLPYRSGSNTPTNVAPSRRPRQRHSPTPEFPPPSVSQAEHTIFEFILPQNAPPPSNRQSLSAHGSKVAEQNLNEANAFIWDGAAPSDDGFDTRSSRASDCVEEFVGEEPFAGLFKGSTLTLNINGGNATNSESQDCYDGNENGQRQVAPNSFEREGSSASGLRSPSLVQAVKPIAAARRQQSLVKPEEDVIDSPLPMPPPISGSELNISKGWEEIYSILESIGSEVQHATASIESGTNNLMIAMEHQQQPQQQEASASQTNGVTNESIHIRQPIDLAMSSNDESLTTSWCHSPNTLIYGHVQYKVYYLGSTVIRELRGTISTRKSIQKLKLDEMVRQEKDGIQAATSLLENCNSSTKILKANNQQTRLEVGISLSHVGVRFIDAENGWTICVHEIENINCVCQDSEDLRYFAYITRENDVHYCHVFMVDNLDLATEIILTLGQAFEVAFQLAVRKRVDVADGAKPVPCVSNAIPITNI